VVANGCGITLYAPNINLVRDPRWGRAEEVYGEDPHLSAELAVAMVTGMQGNREGETVAEDGGPLMSGACCKHFAVYQNENIPEARTQLDANVSARSLWETYMPVMKACVVRAKATHVMCSYNSVNGKPTCAHPDLLNGILREQWKFDGFVVSDYDAWVNLVTTHHYVDTMEEAAAVGINAGTNTIRRLYVLQVWRMVLTIPTLSCRHGPGGRIRDLQRRGRYAPGDLRWQGHRCHRGHGLPPADESAHASWDV
jgi:beta-glucosidase-like glycosyl hydrolase